MAQRMERRHQRLEEHGDALRYGSQAYPETMLFGEPILWVDIARYLRVTLDARMTWSALIDQVRKKAAPSPGVLGPLLKRSSLFIKNAVLL